MVQWNLKGYVAGSILLQTDRGKGCQIEMKESCVRRNCQMKLEAASWHFVGAWTGRYGCLQNRECKNAR